MRATNSSFLVLDFFIFLFFLSGSGVLSLKKTLKAGITLLNTVSGHPRSCCHARNLVNRYVGLLTGGKYAKFLPKLEMAYLQLGRIQEDDASTIDISIQSLQDDLEMLQSCKHTEVTEPITQQSKRHAMDLYILQYYTVYLLMCLELSKEGMHRMHHEYVLDWGFLTYQKALSDFTGGGFSHVEIHRLTGYIRDNICTCIAMEQHTKLMGKSSSSKRDSKFGMRFIEQVQEEFGGGTAANIVDDLVITTTSEQQEKQQEEPEVFQARSEQSFLSGDYHSAVKYAMTALELLSAVDKESKEAGLSYYKLGNVHFKCGNHSAALKSHKRALNIRQTMLGEHNELTAESYYAVGESHAKLGDFSAALENHKNALRIRLELLGEHEKTEESYHAVTESHVKLKEYPAARESHRNALRIHLKLLGEHERTAEPHHAMGESLAKLGDFLVSPAVCFFVFLLFREIFSAC